MQDWDRAQPLRSNYPPSLFLCPDRYMSALSSYYASKGLALVAFERFLALRKTGAGGNHCHVNVIGVPKEAVGLRPVPVLHRARKRSNATSAKPFEAQ